MGRGRSILVALGVGAAVLLAAFAWLVQREAPVAVPTPQAQQLSTAVDGPPASAGSPEGRSAVADSDEEVAIGENIAAQPDLKPLSGEDPTERVVWGFVRDRQGAAIEGAGIVFTDRLGERYTATGAIDGSYSVPGLAPGRWHATARSQGCLMAESILQLAVEGPGATRHDFQLEIQPTLTVRVLTPDGRAFRDADLDAKGQPKWTPLLAVATREPPEAFVRFNVNGRFGSGQMRDFINGARPSGDGAIALLDLFDPLPLYVSLLLSEEVLATQQVLPGQTEVVFVLDPHEIDQHTADLLLTVVDAESRLPVVKAGVILNFGVSSMHSALKPDGSVRYRKLWPGRYEVRVLAEGFACTPVEVDLAPGQVVERRIELGSGFLVNGHCVDERGVPIGGQFMISPLPSAGELPHHLQQDSHHTINLGNADGTFELRLEGGLWLLQPEQRHDDNHRAAPAKMGHNLVVDTRLGAVNDLVVPLYSPSSVVVSWMGSAGEELRLCFLDDEGHVRKLSKLWGAAPHRVHLPPGQWRVRVLDAKGQFLEEVGPFALSSEPVVLELGRGR